MAKAKKSYIDILIIRGVISPDQAREAEIMARETRDRVHDCLVRLGYATGEEVMKAVAEEHGYKYIDLTDISIPPNIVELVPESVARENVILPLVGEQRLAAR